MGEPRFQRDKWGWDGWCSWLQMNYRVAARARRGASFQKMPYMGLPGPQDKSIFGALAPSPGQSPSVLWAWTVAPLCGVPMGPLSCSCCVYVYLALPFMATCFCQPHLFQCQALFSPCVGISCGQMKALRPAEGGGPINHDVAFRQARATPANN